MSQKNLKLIFAVFVIFFISLITFLPSFSLALFGDDWLAFWRYLTHLGPAPREHWTHISYLLTPYGSQDIMMGLLRNIFGFQGTYFQMVSFFLRMIAAFSLYPLISYLTKSKLATFFAILFFAITTTGIETTNWVFNMPTYITISLFNLFLYLFLKEREKKSYLVIAISAIIYYFSYIITPIRMHGSLILVFLLEIFWSFQKKDGKILTRSALRFSLILLVFLFIRFSGQSLGPSNEPIERFTSGIKTSSDLLSKGEIGFIFYPVIILGSMLIPDFILPIGIKNVILLLTGSLILITSLYFIIKHFKKGLVSTGFFLGISWSILSFFFAWWWVPNTIYPGHYRYLAVSAVGISILLALIIGLAKTLRNQVIITAILSSFVILHIVSTNYYFRLMEGFHSQQLTDKIWSSIPYIPTIGKEPVVFYFQGNIDNYVILHNVITFGFPPHMQLLYSLTERDPAPLPMTNWEDVVSAVKDGQSFKPHGYPLKPIGINQVYAFYLEGKDNLINITEIARQKLIEAKQK